MKKILLVNDDGIDAPGLHAMAENLINDYDLRVVAPAVQQSGMSQALSAHSKIKVKKVDFGLPVEAHKVYGTPADCTKLAVEVLYENDLPDMIISGINDGGNLGTDVLYSGTVGAAMEGHLHGILSIAVSRVVGSELSFAEVAQIFSQKLPKLRNEKPYMYNINFPKKIADQNDIFRYTKQGRRTYHNEYAIEINEQGEKCYFMNGTPNDAGNIEGSDIWAIHKGFVSINPLKVGRTNKKLLRELIDG
ncbi:5'/3'-nucleotidase SurE [Pectinatus cerevisiiphilus]|uniref:5'-nucleotidase SurE n=1 Tax=Pectinatus cerevisiiphilus TaxID=86956 RepID=A0A4R3KBX9_9FIRM|nr:5'/3'-nucleotidase SurE [Pectinatus cerevisiiphilus]TCS80409.1 5'-nucleotidase /3'-nucleotidase /exopolyphosphatase [Pectinatus cerevisiiphilus]